jgi:Glycosyl hydrolases family 35.
MERLLGGGLPKFINRMVKKRGDYPKYLNYVRTYWQRLAHEVKPYLDGKTVIGIQLENEYTGKTKHIPYIKKKLQKRLASKTPFFHNDCLAVEKIQKMICLV